MEHILHLLVYGISIALWVLAGVGPLSDEGKGVQTGLIVAGIVIMCFATMIVDLCHSLCTRRSNGNVSVSKSVRMDDAYRHSIFVMMNAIGRNRLLNNDADLRNYSDKLPIIYTPRYNISACGVENAHPFDSKKYGRVMSSLVSADSVHLRDVITPQRATREQLLLVHSAAYLAKLHSSTYLTTILEVPVCCLPSWFIRWRVLEPMLYAVGGSILGARLAWQRGWSINLSGGYHHASADRGSGFCVYADITLAIQHLRKDVPEVQNGIIKRIHRAFSSHYECRLICMCLQ
jgi:hypothetical protein